MDNSPNQRPSGPRLRDVIRDDLRHGDFGSSLEQELRDIPAYYLTRDQHDHLESLRGKHRLRKWFLVAGWVLKEMILRLSPIRRLLVLAAVVLVVLAESNVTSRGTGDPVWEILVAALVFLLVIILEVKDKLLARDELEAGRKVQRALMPEPAPGFDGWEIWLYSRPANEVGGDLVDFFREESGHGLVCIADVAGKGLQAALLMVKLQATIRALAQEETSPARLAARVNSIFRRDSPASMFASLLVAHMEPASGELQYVNAGHLPPLVLRESGVDDLAKGEPALGLAPSTQYTEQKVILNPGETFVAFSDGVVEARNGSGQFYGLDRFRSLLAGHRQLGARALAGTIVADVDGFAGKTSSGDDFSLVILKRV